jgi:hypothetical protein
MHQTQDKIILQGASTWNQWRKENNVSSFSSPNWYESRDSTGRMVKGKNKLNFAGIDLSETSIFKAFAEGLNLAGGIFKNTHFEEGDFSRANFSSATFVNSKFNKTILTDADFNGASFINCNLNRVNLTGAKFCLKEITETVVYGISAWDLHTCEEMKQSKLIIEKTYELYSDFKKNGIVPLMVDNIELAQFIHYLSDHKKMRDTINIFNSKGVLLLGAFKDGGIERLYMLRDWLQTKHYMPMIFDFNRPENQTLLDTIVTMAGLSKFIIADLSGRSVPAELEAIFSRFKKKPLLAYYRADTYPVFQTLKADHPNILDFEISGDADLIQKLDPLIIKAENIHKNIIYEFAEIFK